MKKLRNKQTTLSFVMVPKWWAARLTHTSKADRHKKKLNPEHPMKGGTTLKIHIYCAFQR
jgi:hypothetical protein